MALYGKTLFIMGIAIMSVAFVLAITLLIVHVLLSSNLKKKLEIEYGKIEKK